MAHDPDRVATLVRKLIVEWCTDYNESADRKVELAAGDDARLFGVERVLDSLALVSLLVAVEQGIDDELGVVLTLADEKAASRARSPFKTVGALVAYATERTLEESASNG